MTYSIKDVSNISGFSIFTIRFYDKEGLLPFVSRNKSGKRVFTESDVAMIRTISCLKNTGMPIKEIKKYIDYCMEGAENIALRLELLLEHRKDILVHISALHENLKVIDSKIEIYSSPRAVEIINAQRRYVEEEKRENCLQNPYAEM